MPEAGIGTIAWFDRGKKRGVIAREGAGAKQGSAGELYFECSDAEAMQLKEGQRVQFVVEENANLGRMAKNVTVLSQKA
jgi:cold shock CspA family protein